MVIGDLVEEAKSKYSVKPKFVAREFSEIAHHYINLHGLQIPSDWTEALDLYFALVQGVQTEISQINRTLKLKHLNQTGQSL